MKFIVSSSALLKQINLIGGVISSNTVLPILEDFLFEIKDGKLKAQATDLEISMSTTVDVEAKEEGRVAIPAKILLDTLKTLPEQPIAFSINPENYAVEITSDNGKYKLAGENPDDFPKIPVPEDTTAVDLPSDVLQNAIGKCLFAVSNDELRPAMTGVLFELNPQEITFVATDAHKLVRYTRKDLTIAESAQFIVPKKALNLLKNAIPAQMSNITMSYNDSNAFFQFEGIDLSCRLIDARYPDYNAVIPQDNPHLLSIGRSDFQNSLRRISIFSNKTTHQVILSINGSSLQVSAQDLDFSNEANEKLDCEYTGEDLQIGFNARFLIEMLGVMPGEEVQMKLSTPTRAGLLVPSVPEENEELLMLVMPVMLNV
ncbi:MAG: DNA polymerase III subunit beta [Saprospiraceae bacterium]|nr:DNA polymerase III subunit beta [Saprospiraceae bacterium]